MFAELFISSQTSTSINIVTYSCLLFSFRKKGCALICWLSYFLLCFILSQQKYLDWVNSHPSTKHCPPQSNPWYQTHQTDSLSSRSQVGLALNMSFDLEILDFEQNANQVYSIFFWTKLYLRNFYFRGPQHLIKLGAGTHTMAKLQEHLELRFLSNEISYMI